MQKQEQYVPTDVANVLMEYDFPSCGVLCLTHLTNERGPGWPCRILVIPQELLALIEFM